MLSNGSAAGWPRRGRRSHRWVSHGQAGRIPFGLEGLAGEGRRVVVGEPAAQRLNGGGSMRVRVNGSRTHRVVTRGMNSGIHPAR